MTIEQLKERLREFEVTETVMIKIGDQEYKIMDVKEDDGIVFICDEGQED